MEMPDDSYGRKVTMEEVDGESLYTIDDQNGRVFTVSVTHDTSIEQVYRTIEAMA